MLENSVTQKHLTVDTIHAQFCSDWLKVEIAWLFAENASLREALEDISRSYSGIGDPTIELVERIGIARKALGEK